MQDAFIRASRKVLASKLSTHTSRTYKYSYIRAVEQASTLLLKH
jgi:hypothetical protein